MLRQTGSFSAPLETRASRGFRGNGQHRLSSGSWGEKVNFLISTIRQRSAQKQEVLRRKERTPQLPDIELFRFDIPQYQLQISLCQPHVPLCQPHVPLFQPHIPLFQAHIPLFQSHVPLFQSHIRMTNSRFHCSETICGFPVSYRHVRPPNLSGIISEPCVGGRNQASAFCTMERRLEITCSSEVIDQGDNLQFVVNFR